MSPRPRVAPQRRRQIMDALFCCMARKGYANVSISDIAAEARVARGAINFFFAGKEDILAALLERAIADYQAALRPILEKPDPADTQMRAALEVLLAPTPATQAMMAVFLNYYALAPGNLALAPRLRDFFRDYRRFFALILRRGIRQGCYPRRMDPDQVAAVLVAAVEGLLIQWVISPRTVNPLQAIAWLERLLETAAGGRPSPPWPKRLSHGGHHRVSSSGQHAGPDRPARVR